VVTKTRMSATEFFALPEMNTPTELIDGELIMAPSPVPKHQGISAETYVVLRGLIPNGKLFYAPIDVYLDEGNVVQPDILWVAEGGQCQITDKRLVGAPDLIVEILSPGTTRRDRREKYELYERFGVREYWMIDPDEEYVEVHHLQDGRFQRQGVYIPEQTFESRVLGGKPVEVGRIFGTPQG
jgi:Uma2 family endonuclease